LSLGECFKGQGRTASAWLAYKAAGALAHERHDPRSAGADERALAVEPQLSTIKIHLEDDESTVPVRITINGETFDRGAFGAPVPVDPGEVTIVETAPGYKPWSTTVHVRPFGDAVSLSLPRLAGLPDAQVAAREHAAFATKRILAFSLGGAGLLALNIGTILGFQAIAKIRDANQTCPVNNVCSDRSAVNENQQGRTFGEVSSVLLPVGAALVGAGAFFYVTARVPSSPEITAGVSSGNASLRVRWSW
jgi:hypothetical protein